MRSAYKTERWQNSFTSFETSNSTLGGMWLGLIRRMEYSAEDHETGIRRSLADGGVRAPNLIGWTCNSKYDQVCPLIPAVREIVFRRCWTSSTNLGWSTGQSMLS